MGDPVTLALGGASLIGIGSASQQRKAQKRENREQQKLAAMENNRRIRQAQREARRARAVTEAQGSIAGQLASSSTLGVLGNIQNQIASNVEYMDNAAQLNKNIQNARQKQADWAFYGQMAQLGASAAKSFGSPTGLTATPTQQPSIGANYQTTIAAQPPSVSSTSIYSR
jgi:hypothetical protein